MSLAVLCLIEKIQLLLAVKKLSFIDPLAIRKRIAQTDRHNILTLLHNDYHRSVYVWHMSVSRALLLPVLRPKTVYWTSFVLIFAIFDRYNFLMSWLSNLQQADTKNSPNLVLYCGKNLRKAYSRPMHCSCPMGFKVPIYHIIKV